MVKKLIKVYSRFLIIISVIMALVFISTALSFVITLIQGLISNGTGGGNDILIFIEWFIPLLFLIILLYVLFLSESLIQGLLLLGFEKKGNKEYLLFTGLVCIWGIIKNVICYNSNFFNLQNVYLICAILNAIALIITFVIYEITRYNERMEKEKY